MPPDSGKDLSLPPGSSSSSSVIANNLAASMHNNSPSAGFDVVKKEPSERLYSPDLGLGGVGGSAGGSYHLGATGGGGRAREE